MVVAPVPRNTVPTFPSLLAPQGHVEAGETALQAAQRELTEESGLSSPATAIVVHGDAPVTSQSYTFTSRAGARVRKTVHFFACTTVAPLCDDVAFGPRERGTKALQWVPVDRVRAGAVEFKAAAHGGSIIAAADALVRRGVL